MVVALVVLTLVVSLSAAASVAQEGSGFPGASEHPTAHEVKQHEVKQLGALEHVEVLPETGGPSLLMLGSGVLLVGCGLLALRVRR